MLNNFFGQKSIDMADVPKWASNTWLTAKKEKNTESNEGYRQNISKNLKIPNFTVFGRFQLPLICSANRL